MKISESLDNCILHRVVIEASQKFGTKNAINRVVFWRRNFFEAKFKILSIK